MSRSDEFIDFQQQEGNRRAVRDWERVKQAADLEDRRQMVGHNLALVEEIEDSVVRKNRKTEEEKQTGPSVKIKVIREYRNREIHYTPGQEIEVGQEKAAWLMNDSPGCFELEEGE